MASIYTADEIMSLGLSLCGLGEERQCRQKRTECIADFKAFFGVQPVVVAQVWEDLQQHGLIDPTIAKGNANISTFLHSLNFIKAYLLERQRKGSTGFCRTTLRKWAWYFLKAVAALKAWKIKFPDANEWTTTFIISVDGVHFRFHERKHATKSKDPDYYSHKFKGAGLSYEFALHLLKPQLVWVRDC